MKRTAILAIAVLAIPAFAEIIVTIDGNRVNFTRMQPQIRRGKVYVPLRGVFESLGADVQYTEKTKLIQVMKGNESIELRIGYKMANKNGSEILMDAVPFLRNGRALVPLRFLAESLRADVGWNEATQTVEITTGGSSVWWPKIDACLSSTVAGDASRKNAAAGRDGWWLMING